MKHCTDSSPNLGNAFDRAEVYSQAPLRLISWCSFELPQAAKRRANDNIAQGHIAEPSKPWPVAGFVIVSFLGPY